MPPHPPRSPRTPRRVSACFPIHWTPPVTHPLGAAAGMYMLAGSPEARQSARQQVATVTVKEETNRLAMGH